MSSTTCLKCGFTNSSFADTIRLAKTVSIGKEINALDGVCLESQVVDFVEAQVEKLAAAQPIT